MDTRPVTCGTCGCTKDVPTGAALRELRARAGLTAAQLAGLVGCHISLVQRCEYDLRTPPQKLIDTLLDLAAPAA